MKKVSLIIPVFNTVNLLRRCLESAVNQSYPEMEIICVDDGSTDGSEIILDEYAKRDSRLIVIHQKNKGESAARNAGLKIASGNYIGFMDCDDWIELSMYERMVYEMQSRNVDLAAYGYFISTDFKSVPVKNKKIVSENVFDRTSLYQYVYERDAYKGFTSWIWCKLFKRELLEQNGELLLFDETFRMGADILFFHKAASRVNTAYYIPDPYYHYYQRPTSTSHSSDLEIVVDMINVYQRMIDFMETEGIEQESAIWLKRFKVYWATILGERAYDQGNKFHLQLAQNTMKQYRQEYINTNKQYPDRLKRYDEILAYRLV